MECGNERKGMKNEKKKKGEEAFKRKKERKKIRKKKVRLETQSLSHFLRLAGNDRRLRQLRSGLASSIRR